ncbi:hypothetical protein J6590_046369 [Homalodisca vitripennis]|nr:hypothetical protein J6590_046369 [Homalodisca vitripennis]
MAEMFSQELSSKSKLKSSPARHYVRWRGGKLTTTSTWAVGEGGEETTTSTCYSCRRHGCGYLHSNMRYIVLEKDNLRTVMSGCKAWDGNLATPVGAQQGAGWATMVTTPTSVSIAPVGAACTNVAAPGVSSSLDAVVVVCVPESHKKVCRSSMDTRVVTAPAGFVL